MNRKIIQKGAMILGLISIISNIDSAQQPARTEASTGSQRVSTGAGAQRSLGGNAAVSHSMSSGAGTRSHHAGSRHGGSRHGGRHSGGRHHGGGKHRGHHGGRSRSRGSFYVGLTPSYYDYSYDPYYYDYDYYPYYSDYDYYPYYGYDYPYYGSYYSRPYYRSSYVSTPFLGLGFGFGGSRRRRHRW